MQIPVLQKSNNTNQLVLLDLSEVIYICVENRGLVYHTEHERYYQLSTLSDLEEHLHSFGFDMLDKTNLVNCQKIKKMDDAQGKIFFEEEPTSMSKYATIALIKQKLFGKQIQKSIAKNTHKTIQYTLKDHDRSRPIKERKEDYQT
jgi:DNA-binding LytR/AlgR family response regulator